MNSSPDPPQGFVAVIEIEFFRVEPAVDPFKIFVVFFMIGITDGFQKIFIAADAATILGWTGAGTADTARIPRAALGF